MAEPSASGAAAHGPDLAGQTGLEAGRRFLEQLREQGAAAVAAAAASGAAGSSGSSAPAPTSSSAPAVAGAGAVSPPRTSRLASVPALYMPPPFTEEEDDEEAGSRRASLSTGTASTAGVSAAAAAARAGAGDAAGHSQSRSGGGSRSQQQQQRHEQHQRLLQETAITVLGVPPAVGEHAWVWCGRALCGAAPWLCWQALDAGRHKHDFVLRFLSLLFVVVSSSVLIPDPCLPCWVRRFPTSSWPTPLRNALALSRRAGWAVSSTPAASSIGWCAHRAVP